jgi:hypothetical protein
LAQLSVSVVPLRQMILDEESVILDSKPGWKSLRTKKIEKVPKGCEDFPSWH